VWSELDRSEKTTAQSIKSRDKTHFWRYTAISTGQIYGGTEKKENPETIAASGFSWLRGLDLNQRPPGYEFEETNVLTTYSVIKSVNYLILCNKFIVSAQSTKARRCKMAVHLWRYGGTVGNVSL